MKKLRNVKQNYDAWLHWDATKRCNLDCEYCFGKITDASVKVHSIKINELLKSLNKTGKTFRISFTGGEPTLIPNFVEACKAISEEHFISFNSNLISNRTMELAEIITPDRILHIHASFHYDELVRTNNLERFAAHYHHFVNNGFNIYAEAVAYPQAKNNFEAIMKFANSNLIDLKFAPFFGQHNGETYPDSYSAEDFELFGISKTILSNFAQEGELCNAGQNAAVVFSNGNAYPCHQIKTRIGNIYEGIEFGSDQVSCPAKKCGCPLNKYDDYLFEKSCGL